jgi:hypothetical protein
MRVGTCQPKLHFEVINAGSFTVGPEELVLWERRVGSVVLLEFWNVWLFELKKVWLANGTGEYLLPCPGLNILAMLIMHKIEQRKTDQQVREYHLSYEKSLQSSLQGIKLRSTHAVAQRLGTNQPVLQ